MVVNEVERAYKSGQISSKLLRLAGDEWCERMVRSGAPTDHTFLEMAAQVLDTDLVIIPLHPLPSGDPFHLISAGLLSDGSRGRNVPIFIGIKQYKYNDTSECQA